MPDLVLVDVRDVSIYGVDACRILDMTKLDEIMGIMGVHRDDYHHIGFVFSPEDSLDPFFAMCCDSDRKKFESACVKQSLVYDKKDRLVVSIRKQFAKEHNVVAAWTSDRYFLELLAKKPYLPTGFVANGFSALVCDFDNTVYLRDRSLREMYKPMVQCAIALKTYLQSLESLPRFTMRKLDRFLDAFGTYPITSYADDSIFNISDFIERFDSLVAFCEKNNVLEGATEIKRMIVHTQSLPRYLSEPIIKRMDDMMIQGKPVQVTTARAAETKQSETYKRTESVDAIQKNASFVAHTSYFSKWLPKLLSERNTLNTASAKCPCCDRYATKLEWIAAQIVLELLPSGTIEFIDDNKREISPELVRKVNDYLAPYNAGIVAARSHVESVLDTSAGEEKHHVDAAELFCSSCEPARVIDQLVLTCRGGMSLEKAWSAVWSGLELKTQQTATKGSSVQDLLAQSLWALMPASVADTAAYLDETTSAGSASRLEG